MQALCCEAHRAAGCHRMQTSTAMGMHEGTILLSYRSRCLEQDVPYKYQVAFIH